MSKLKTLGAKEDEKQVSDSVLPDQVEGSVHAKQLDDNLRKMTNPKDQVPLGSADQSESQPTPREKK